MQEEGGGDMKLVAQNMYQHPGYNLNREEHEQLLLEAGKMSAILDGSQVRPLALQHCHASPQPGRSWWCQAAGKHST